MVFGLIGIPPPIMALNGGSCAKNRITETFCKKPRGKLEKSNFSRYGFGK